MKDRLESKQVIPLRHLLNQSFVRPFGGGKGLRIYIAGDSYVQGTGGRIEDSLAHQIIRCLEKVIPIDFLRIYARDGATVEEIASNTQSLYPQSNPDEGALSVPENERFDIIIVNGGVNNQYRKGAGIPGFYDGLNKKLYPTLERLIKKNGIIFKIDSIDWSKTPAGQSGEGYRYRVDEKKGYEVVRREAVVNPVYNTPEGVSADIAEYNERDKQVAAERGVHFIAISGKTKEFVLKTQSDKVEEKKFVDPIHFSGDVHSYQAQIIAGTVVAVLEERGPIGEPYRTGIVDVGIQSGRVMGPGGFRSAL